MAKPATDPFPRMLPKFTVGDGCWEWHGAKTEHGYGKILTFRSIRAAHRVLYELLVGEVPNGMELDHLCRNPACVNPGHLEPVTHQQNIMRSPRNGQSTCADGHARIPENTYVYIYKGVERRYCKPCQQARNRQRQLLKGA